MKSIRSLFAATLFATALPALAVGVAAVALLLYAPAS